MFYIRADGNEQIGMGHIRRCMSIAEALLEAGEEVCFLIADEHPAKILEEAGFRYEILFTYFDEMDVELPQLVLKLSVPGADGKAPRILVDSYYVTAFYLKNLMLQAQVFLLDDNAVKELPCHRLINYNIHAQSLGYAEKYPQAKLYLGPAYAPLRAEFGADPVVIREQVRDILVTTGGADHCHMELALAEAVIDQRLPEATYHLVCGPFSTDGEALDALAKEHPQLQIHHHVTEMAPLMRSCDIAISAAGSTLYELCALGLPTIGFCVASNQHQNMEAFAKQTPIMNAGDFENAPGEVLNFIGKEVTLLMAEKELREKIAAAMRTIVDGQGAKRLANALLTE
ncbi:MAG: UDP-2,4-diacetamido-2,4,6-trideoxy-beta-L-altropyranose hydrolase [Lachnospiraceae bacterium]|nr:UDP-2,4-diacetamido-2,4,6-trideoxy-beta-L-altropyranose hydrolase [Lachnospiraceae bacterium]